MRCKLDMRLLVALVLALAAGGAAARADVNYAPTVIYTKDIGNGETITVTRSVRLNVQWPNYPPPQIQGRRVDVMDSVFSLSKEGAPPQVLWTDQAMTTTGPPTEGLMQIATLYFYDLSFDGKYLAYLTHSYGFTSPLATVVQTGASPKEVIRNFQQGALGSPKIYPKGCWIKSATLTGSYKAGTLMALAHLGDGSTIAFSLKKGRSKYEPMLSTPAAPLPAPK